MAIGRGGVWAKLDSNGPGGQSGRGVEAIIGYLRSEDVCSVEVHYVHSCSLSAARAAALWHRLGLDKRLYKSTAP